MKNYRELLNRFNIKVHNSRYYELALTHPSFNVEAKTKHQDYEKIEFMGDSVLGYISADLVYRLRPEMDEGLLTKLKSYLVRSESLANYARKINLANYIRVGHSINEEQINSSDKILEDVFEALIGAIYLDNDIHTAFEFVASFLTDDVKNTAEIDLTDAKTRLQEEMQAEYRDCVHYVLAKQEGPAHDRLFTVNVMFNDIVLASGTGKSKKAAEEAAAKLALSKRKVL